MPLLDYTTKVPVPQTIGQIQKILTSHSAKAILMDYSDHGTIEALTFKIKTPSGEVGIRLPIDIESTYRVMQRQVNNGEMPKHFANKDQASRVAWRNIKDWVEAQMALLETGMVRMEQIFLPYVITGSGKTVYEVVAGEHFLLGSGNKGGRQS